MRIVLMAAAALVTLAGAAAAQGATQTVTLTATVNDYCAINGGGNAPGSATIDSENVHLTTVQGNSGQQTSFTCTQNVMISTDSLNDGMLRIVTLAPAP
jgi:hypothetical protein